MGKTQETIECIVGEPGSGIGGEVIELDGQSSVLVFPVPGFPGYVVTSIGAVYSTKGSAPRRLQVHETKTGALYVRIYNANGSRHTVRIRKLLYGHGIMLENWMKDQLRLENRLP